MQSALMQVIASNFWVTRKGRFQPGVFTVALTSGARLYEVEKYCPISPLPWSRLHPPKHLTLDWFQAGFVRMGTPRLLHRPREVSLPVPSFRSKGLCFGCHGIILYAKNWVPPQTSSIRYLPVLCCRRSTGCFSVGFMMSWVHPVSAARSPGSAPSLWTELFASLACLLGPQKSLPICLSVFRILLMVQGTEPKFIHLATDLCNLLSIPFVIC